MAQFLRFVRLIRTVVESVAGGVCRNTGGSILTLESILVVASPVAEVRISLVRHVEAVGVAVADGGVVVAGAVVAGVLVRLAVGTIVSVAAGLVRLVGAVRLAVAHQAERRTGHVLHIHLVWSQWDTVIFLISMSHHLSSNFDINVPNLSHPLNTGFPHIPEELPFLGYILLYCTFF